MKRLSLFLAVSLLTGAARGCYFAPYTPGDAHLYRIMEEVALYETEGYCPQRRYLWQKFDYQEENLRLWREQTGTTVSDGLLRQAIYDAGASELLNTVLGDDDEAKCCLTTAREVSRVRALMADPWYFPSKASYESGTLEELLETCREHLSGDFRGRYVLQALRCLNSMYRSAECVELWEQQRDSMDRDVVFRMAEREAAAAYHRTGRDDVACDIYARVGDIASLRMCRSGRDDEMEYIYERCPDSPYFPEEIQALLTKADMNLGKEDDYRGWWTKEDSLRLVDFQSLCRRVLRERKVKDRAMWLYAMAAVLDVQGRPREALAYLRQGESACHDDFLRSSFRVLRMHLEARTLPMNHGYDQRLLCDLRWLCGMIDRNLHRPQRRRLRELNSYKWDVNTYFWNDAMRRILLSDVCPRMVKAGRTTRALQLANFADHYLFRRLGVSGMETTEVWEENRWTEWSWDNHSYSNAVFALADSLNADQLATYVRWQRQGQGELDSLLARGSRTDVGYWADIVGTHYLREYRYSEAARWFARLPKGFEKETNLYRERKDYLLRDPFDLSLNDPNSNRGRLETTTDYKLNYARRMVHYEHNMKYGRTADVRAEAKIYYAVGRRNQWSYCWALTRYEDGENWWWTAATGYCYEGNKPLHEEFSLCYERLVEETGKAIEEALKEIGDKELKARLLHGMQRNREVMDLCPGTETANFLRKHCDTWRDYVNRKV